MDGDDGEESTDEVDVMNAERGDSEQKKLG